MDMTENELFEAFGLETPNTGNPTPKPPESPPETPESPPETPESPPETPESPPETPESLPETPESLPETPESSDISDAGLAAQKKQQEVIAAAVSKALEDERAKLAAKTEDEYKSFFATAMLKNTFTGAPITNMTEFREWRKAYDASQLENDLKAGKLTPESFNKLIEDNPVIRKAEEVIRATEEERQRQSMATAKVRIDAELAEIGKLDPSIKTPADLSKMPNAKQFFEYLHRGNTLTDAYYLANRERIQSEAAAAAKQQAINNARSKDHLTATAARAGTPSVTVPKDEMEMFRAFMPNATDAEIQAYYNKHKANP